MKRSLESSTTLSALLAIGLCLTGFGSHAEAQGSDHFGKVINWAGVMNFRVHVPPSYDPDEPMPMVVAIHGCLMTGYGFNSMEDTTQLSDLADEEGFLVLYPTQSILRNTTLCWNFDKPKHQTRGAGEPSLIAGAVEMAKEDLAVDDSRVYVLGASSGAAMAVVMAVTYPDVFAAVGVGAGCEYACEPDLKDTPELMPEPTETAELAYAAMGSHAKRVPAVILQGSEDPTVPLFAAERLVTHWAHLNDLAGDGMADLDITDQPDSVEGVPGSDDQYPVLVTRYRDRDSGRVLIERHIAFGLGHAWTGGGVGFFADPNGPDASHLMWNFLSAYTMDDFH